MANGGGKWKCPVCGDRIEHCVAVDGDEKNWKWNAVENAWAHYHMNSTVDVIIAIAEKVE